MPSLLMGEELIFGEPSPKFTAKMLRGEPIVNLANGQIHVVEFTGTGCAPCIKLIPEMNELQKRYSNVDFVSVFCERTDDVKRFMEGPGKPMEVRVAVDESRRMQKDWLGAAGLQGIPLAFIVDNTGVLAWFGYANEKAFAESLEQVVNGSYDGRLEKMRMVLTRKLEDEARKSLEWCERVNEVTNAANACNTPEESIAILDKALPEFARSPERIVLCISKLEFLQAVPNGRERAYQHALTLAVEAINERNPNHYVYACEAMLWHVESALPENRDSCLADLALAVLLDETAPKNHVRRHPAPDGEIDFRVNRLAAIANAHRLRGEWPIAMETLEKAIAISQQREMNNKPEWWIDEQKQALAHLESRLDEWKDLNKIPQAK